MPVKIKNSKVVKYLNNKVLTAMPTPAEANQRVRIQDDPTKPNGQKGLIAEKMPSGKIVFRVYYRFHGNPKTFKLGEWPTTTVDEARKKAKLKLAEAADGDKDFTVEKREKKEAAENAKLAEKEEAQKILSIYIKDVYSKSAKVESMKSGEATLSRLEACFKKDFYSMPMSKITAEEVVKWRRRRIKGIKGYGQGKEKNVPITPASVNRDITTLRAVLSHAVKQKILAFHPMQGLEQLGVDDDDRVRYLTDDEETRLRAVLAARTDHMPSLVLLAMNTGMRRGELFSLTWKHVNFDLKQATVAAKTSKTSTTRRIQLNPEAMQVLEELHGDKASGLVFKSPSKNSKTGRLTSVKTAWMKITDDAKLVDFHFHDLRHHFASKLVMAGVDLYTVQKLLGHSNSKMTQRYAHLAPEHFQNAVNKLKKP